MRRPAAAIACVIGTAFAHAPSTSLSKDDLREITVDTASVIGTLRPLHGVNGAPGPGFHKPENFLFGGWNMPAAIDASEGYRRARISLVRTHDAYGPGDIDARFGTPENQLISAERNVFNIFPDPNADPRDPKSYNFGPTDRLIASIRNVGAEVMFRLGRSEGAAVEPPADFDRYAQVVRHIVLHYNKGWANGFHYGIRYWEFWNEPDLGKLFWGGTPDQFFELYGKAAKAIKEADPDALVGGPALAKPNDANPYREGFLEYVRARRLPLDFYTWHWYATDSNDPFDVIRIAHNVRQLLDRYGFSETRSVVNEWNYGLLDPPPPSVQRAGFITSALTYMQDAPVDMAALYRADNVFGKDGATPDKVGQALIALGKMQDTPVRLTVHGADENGLAVQAGHSADGRLLRVLISNYEIPAEFIGPRKTPNVLSIPGAFEVGLLERRSVTYLNNAGYDLTVAALPADCPYAVERYRISKDRDLALVDRTTLAGDSLRLQAKLPAPAMELIEVRAPAAGRNRCNIKERTRAQPTQKEPAPRGAGSKTSD